MRAANPPLGPAGRSIRIPRLELSPDRALVLANVLSLSRGIAALCIFAMSIAGAPVVAVLAVAAPMWLTDALDGFVARNARDRGASLRSDGAALDPLMDDVAFVCGFLVLFEAGVAPLWFVTFLLLSRVLFMLVRLLGAVYREPFARPLPLTKLNGAVLAIGQLLLLAHLAFPASIAGSDALVSAAIATMTVTTTCSVIQFTIRKHGRLFARLLTP